MKILTLEKILDTCNGVQDGQFDYTLTFASMEERALWFHYYGNLIKQYCGINMYKSVPTIVAHLHDHLIDEMMG